MPKVKVLARGWLIEASDTIDPVTTLPTWVKVSGINTFTISSDKEDTDTTDFDSGGHSDHMVTNRSNEVSFEGYYLEDPVDGSRDPGQELIDELSELVGPEAFGDVRLTSPGGKVRQFKASFGTGDVGGGTNDATSWGATATPTGPPIRVNP